MANQAVQRIGASRFAQRQIEPQRRLAPIADLCVRQRSMSDTHKFDGDDSEINAAVEEAQRRSPEFQRALNEDARRLIPAIEGALVKARFESPITHKIEHMWVEDVGFE